MWLGILINIILYAILIIVIIQDFKTRTIVWWSPILLLLIGIVIHYKHCSEFNIHYILINLTFFLIQLLGLTLYFSWKKKKWINITKEYFGLGDVLFLIPLCLLFTPINLIIFFVVSLIITLISSFIYLFINKKNLNFTIPFAGIIAICFLLKEGINLIVRTSNFDDFFILNYLINTSL